MIGIPELLTVLGTLAMAGTYIWIVHRLLSQVEAKERLISQSDDKAGLESKQTVENSRPPWHQLRPWV